MQASQESSKTIAFHNVGKYPIDYACTITQAKLKSAFAIQPSNGTLLPGVSCDVSVLFNQGGSLKREISLNNATALQLDLIEPTTGVKENAVVIPVRSKP
jgi:hypothetical protein